MKKFWESSLILAALFAVACNGFPGRPNPPAPPETQAFAVVVKDFVQPDKPVEGVSVTCARDGFTIGHQITNGDGYVSFGPVQSYNVYTCLLVKENYEDNTSRHYLTPEDATLYVPLTPKAPPTPEVPPGLQGLVRIEGNCYRDDTGCVNLVYAHLGDGFSRFVRDPEYVKLQLNDIAQAGYHGVRVWAVLGGRYWAGREVGPGVTPDYFVRLGEFFDELKARNLRAVWSMGDIGQLRIPRREYMELLHQTDQNRRVIDWLDCGNEAWQTGESDPRRLAECVNYYRVAGGQALLTLTSPPSEETEDLDKYSIPPANAYDVHGYRGGHHWDKVRHIFSIPYEGRPNKRQGIQSEPFGNGGLVSVTENRDELNHEAMAMGAIMSAVGRQAWVWFSGEGVILQRGIATQQGFWQSPAAIKLLPTDVSTFPTIHHSGNTWGNIRLLVPPQDNVRVDGVQHPDGRTVQVIYGPTGGYNFRVNRSAVGKLCNPGDTSCVDVTWTAGETVNIAFDRGRVFIGRFQ